MAENGTEPEVTEDDKLALELVAGKSVRAASAAAGVSERTAHRRQQDPQFRERVLELRRIVT